MMNENGLPTLVPGKPLRWDGRIAAWISKFASPPILAVAGSLMVAGYIGTTSAWLWMAFQAVFNVLLPVMFILWLLREGRISDFDIYYRKQRFRPYIFITSCGIVTSLVMALGGAPRLMVILSITGVVQTVALFLINMWWKISAHSAATASFTILLGGLFGASLLPYLLGVPLMVWSRVRLKRHTLTQTLAGTLLGTLVIILLLGIWL